MAFSQSGDDFGNFISEDSDVVPANETNIVEYSQKKDEEQQQKQQPEFLDNESLENYIIYRGKGVIQITDDFFEKLFYDPRQGSGHLTSITFDESSLVVTVLPEEVWLIIFEYLSVRNVLSIGMVCKDFNDLTFDRELWRRLAVRHEKLFSWNKLGIKEDVQDPFVIGYQFNIDEKIEELEEKQAEEIKKAKKEEENLSLLRSTRTIRLEKRTISESRIQEMYQSTPNLLQNIEQPSDKRNIFNRVRPRRRKGESDSQTTRINENNETVPLALSTPRKRIEYINLLENPRESLIEKFQALIKQKKEVDEFVERYRKERMERIRNQKKKDDYFISFSLVVSLFHFSLIVFLILLNLRCDNVISLKYSIAYIPVFIMLAVAGILLFFLSRLVEHGYEKRSFLAASLLTELFNIQFLLFALKTDNTITVNWPTAMIPLYIIIGVGTILMCGYCVANLESIGLLYIFYLAGFMFDLFVIFLSLKLNGNTSMNWASVFSPLFVIYLLPCCTCCATIQMEEGWVYQIFSVVLFIFIIPIGVFQILLSIYLQGSSSISLMSYVLIPLYILNGFIVFFTFPSCLVALFQLFCYDNSYDYY
ncbi:fam11a b protein [Anaeramoeba ignava]|uniref:Fam11a b protein n=1 Tax=Anaeramoeba ignava TaxID=1746090 RepID=A0A9Q0RAH9_ANAIG|nr:fam11a b protein [Anaeramoeba ignava]